MVLGIQARWPETGYGYIEFPKGVKPGSLHAAKVIASGKSQMPPAAAAFLACGKLLLECRACSFGELRCC